MRALLLLIYDAAINTFRITRIRIIKIIAKIDISFLLILNIDRPHLGNYSKIFQRKTLNTFALRELINLID